MVRSCDEPKATAGCNPDNATPEDLERTTQSRTSSFREQVNHLEEHLPIPKQLVGTHRNQLRRSRILSPLFASASGLASLRVPCAERPPINLASFLTLERLALNHIARQCLVFASVLQSSGRGFLVGHVPNRYLRQPYRFVTSRSAGHSILFLSPFDTFTARLF